MVQGIAITSNLIAYQKIKCFSSAPLLTSLTLLKHSWPQVLPCPSPLLQLLSAAPYLFTQHHHSAVHHHLGIMFYVVLSPLSLKM